MQLLKKIIWKRSNKRQLLWAMLGAVIGLVLLLGSVQIYLNIQDIIAGDTDSQEQFVIINKRVNLFNTLGVKSTFDQKEIDDLNAQSFVESVGTFTANQYKVSATSPLLGFYTELFFESVPDDYLDIDSDFSWEEGQNELPIVVSKDYLALYNFGFAPSQGLPQFTPSTISRVTLDINLRGRATKQTFTGRVVGFSNRINSILVPENFMQWANQRFGAGIDKASSRLIIKTDKASLPALENYLEEKTYELSGGKLINGQIDQLLQIAMAAILLIGIIILLLSIIVFLLNYQLLIAQADEDIRRLLHLGYTTKELGQILLKRLLVNFVICILITLLIVCILQYGLANFLNGQGYEIALLPSYWIGIIAFLISMAFVGVNYWSIQNALKRLL